MGSCATAPSLTVGYLCCESKKNACPECHIFPRRLKLYCEHSSLGSHQARCNNHFFDIDCIARGAQMIAQSTSWFLADDHPLPSVLEFFFRVYTPPSICQGQCNWFSILQENSKCRVQRLDNFQFSSYIHALSPYHYGSYLGCIL